ncbi:hypothetical protein IV203_011875 [Nitzschia inconspicua]|uniref:Uncharacterized protein n=1 Tax=Nitzschia inconspicua TaxID=303405 RepID=A0A9K3KUG5_9STRA|nr:hypothetical protein IV203_011875 [Nitzschia inconspicua]
MTRSTRPSKNVRRSSERRAAANQEDAAGSYEEDCNNETDDAVAAPDAPAAVAAAAASAGQGRRILRSARSKDKNSTAASSSENNSDAKEAEIRVSSGSKRKRAFMSSDGSSTKQLQQQQQQQSRTSRSKTAAAAAPKNDFPSDPLNGLEETETSASRKRRSHGPEYDGGGGGGGGDNILEAFCRMLTQGAPQEQPGEAPGLPPSIDIQKAANVLEAAAGNLALAVNLYWDDYFATVNNNNDTNHAAAAPQEEPQHGDEKVAAGNSNPKYRKKRGQAVKADKSNSRGASESAQEMDESEGDEDNDDSKPPARGGRRSREHRRAEETTARRMRRSLDPDFRAADKAGNNDSLEENRRSRQDPDEEMEDTHNESGSGDEDEDEDGSNANNDNEENQAPADGDVFMVNEANNNDGSISVSDDELPRRFARVRFGRTVRANAGRQSHPSAVERRIREAAAAISKKVLNYKESPDAVKKRREKDDEDLSLTENPEDYISDGDWFQPQTTLALELLWGSTDASSSGASNPENNNAPDRNRNNNDGTGGGNPINVEQDDNESDEADGEETEGGGIPYTWLNDGFHLSDCGTGLVVKMPKEEDIELLAWRQRNSGSRRNSLPPPIHCMGITAILSIVTSLLYTGASIQGNVVNCTTAKKPWFKLSKEDRKKEFEDRLTDALSSLLYVAADASRKRKQVALRLMRKRLSSATNPSLEELEKAKLLTARMNLVPTCTWEEDLVVALVPRTPDGPSTRQIPIKTSWTNIQDIRLYVLSTIRSFTSKGGIALFLETLIRIHGTQTIKRKMTKCREHQIAEIKQPVASSQDAQQKTSAGRTKYTLIRCRCEERQEQLFEGKPVPLNIRNDPSKLISKLTPPGTECVFDGLVRLMLSGELSGSWGDCVPKGIGIGLLTGHSEVSLALSRPERPVWVIKGPTCYSVLFMEEERDMDMKVAAKIDKAYSSLHLSHWNTWYLSSHKTKLRVITGLPTQRSSKLQQQLSRMETKLNAKPPTPNRMLSERNRWNLVDSVCAEQYRHVQSELSEDVVQTADLERVRIHPEDEKLYPNKRQMWRFHMGDDDDVDLDQKPKAEGWTSYHRLNKREKRIIELKLGPKINHILWTRWPAATIDSFTNDPIV